MTNRFARRDFAVRYARMEERARLERVRRKGHTETKTWTIDVLTVDTIWLPPFRVGIDADAMTPEWKQIIEFSGKCFGGYVDCIPTVNDVEIVMDPSGDLYFDYTAEVTKTPAADLFVKHGDWVGIEVVDVDPSNATTVSVAVTMIAVSR